MKLNHDCVRDLLLFVEENLSYGHQYHINDSPLAGYDYETVLYAADKLVEAGYLTANISRYASSIRPDIFVTGITWNGHQFLDNIRDDGVWKDTKKVLSKFTSTSLGIVSNVASQVIASLIAKTLSL